MTPPPPSPIPNLQGFLHAQRSSFLGTTPLPVPSPSSSVSLIKPKLPRHKPIINSPLSSSRPVPPCTECEKRFPSWKALFGHMRCHPERQWRGINPPPNHHHLLLHRCPPRTHFNVEEYEIASSLVMLANGPRRVVRARRQRRRDVEEHKCGVCFRGFSSGQAFGGHLRCHAEDGGAGWAVFSPSGVDFVPDLNLPPPLKGDGGGGGGGDELGAVSDLRVIM